MLYLNKFQFKIFWHGLDLANAKDTGDDIFGGVTHLPEVGHDLVGFVNLTLRAMSDHFFNQQRMRFVTNLIETTQRKLMSVTVKCFVCVINFLKCNISNKHKRNDK